MKAPYTSIVYIVDFLYSILTLIKQSDSNCATDSPYILTIFVVFQLRVHEPLLWRDYTYAVCAAWSDDFLHSRDKT